MWGVRHPVSLSILLKMISRVLMGEALRECAVILSHVKIVQAKSHEKSVSSCN